MRIEAAAQRRPGRVVIIVTGYCTAENAKAALGIGDHLAVKPFDSDQLKRVLARLLSFRNERMATSQPARKRARPGSSGSVA
jgi:DNA-binding NtrC family response regulator